MQARDRIEAEIAAAGGWISFARYMQLALHEPGVGYYASGARKFGAEGDFITAPELGSLFGRTLARELRAFDLILETSADLIGRQKEKLGHRVRHVDRLPERFSGAVIANEVLDAMPVHMVHWSDRGIFERGVGTGLTWADRPAMGELLAMAQS